MPESNDVSDKVQIRLDALEHYRNHNNAAATGRKFGVSRQTICNWRNKYNPTDPKSLEDQSRAHRSHPQTTPPETVTQIKSLAIWYPTLSCREIAGRIKPPHDTRSAQTVASILRNANLTTAEQRWLANEALLRERMQVWGMLEAPRQKFLLGWNPRLRDHKFRGSRPGEALCIGSVSLGKFGGIGPVMMGCAVDSFSCCVSARLYPGRNSVDPIELLQRAMQFFDNFDWQITRTKAHRNLFKSETQKQHFETQVEKLGISEVVGGSNARKPSGFVRHFALLAKREFADKRSRRKRENLQTLQADFNRWLGNYNETRQMPGFPSYGNSPMEMIQQARTQAV